MIQDISNGSDNAVSCIRVLATVAIILCHIFQYYGIELAWWFNVGVQVFFVMSGFLYGTRSIDDPVAFIRRRFKRILVPYYLFVIPLLLLHIIVLGESFSAKKILGLLLCGSVIRGAEHLWFLEYILFCYLLTPYLYWLRKKMEEMTVPGCLALVVALLGIYQLWQLLMNTRYAPVSIGCYVVGYFASYFIRRCGKKALSVSAWAFGIAAILMNSVRIYVKYIAPDMMGVVPEWVFSYFENYAHAALGAGLFFTAYTLFSRSRGGICLQLSDRYSYYIYIAHQVFILGPFTLLSLTDQPAVNICAVLVCSILVALLLKWAADRIYGWLSRT